MRFFGLGLAWWLALCSLGACGGQSAADSGGLDSSVDVVAPPDTPAIDAPSVDTPTLDVPLLGDAPLSMDVPMLADADAAAAAPTVTFNAASSTEVCKVTNDSIGGTNNLSCNADFGGADLGISVFDGANTWIFFGDSKGLDARAWRQGADATGYFQGRDAMAGLCGGLNLLTVQGVTSTQACGQSGVFDPDVILAPTAWTEPISDFIYQPVTNSSTGPTLPAQGAIPGTNEVPTGAFAYGGSIYVFYQGSPWINANSANGLPVGSLSYMTRWAQPMPGAQALLTKPIISKVDYNLLNPSYPPPAQTTPPCPLPTPTPPSGWPSAPPLGGNFIQMASAVATDDTGTKYVYFFGAGAFRASHISLARLALPTDGTPLDAHVAEYLVNSAGFEVWTGTAWGAYNGSNGATLQFADDTAADIGEMSVQYFAAPRVWLLMYAPSHTASIVMRWATSPTGPWSNENVVLDMSLMANRMLYCCQGTATGTDSHGLPLYGCPGQQVLECGNATSSVGTPRTNMYSPYMLPYLTPAAPANTYTVSYVLSSFEPYSAQLMSYTITVTP